MEENKDESFRIVAVWGTADPGVSSHKFCPDSFESSVEKTKYWLNVRSTKTVKYVALLRNPGKKAVPNHSAALRQAFETWGDEVRKFLNEGLPAPDLVKYLLARRSSIGDADFSEVSGVQQILSLEISPKEGSWRKQVLDALGDYSGGPVLHRPEQMSLSPSQALGQLELF